MDLLELVPELVPPKVTVGADNFLSTFWPGQSFSMTEVTGGSFSVSESASATNPRALLSPCSGEMLHCDSLLGEDPLSAVTADTAETAEIADTADTGESSDTADTGETGEVPAELLARQEGGGV